MGLRGKLAAEIEIHSPPEAYFKRLKEELHHLPNAASGVQGVEVHEGDFKTHGSIKSWTYTLDGKTEVFKERFEIDEVGMTVSMVAVGGHILERYKSYAIIYKVIPKTRNEPPVVSVTLAYEKFKDTDAEPLKEIDFMITLVKDVDKHLLGQ